MTRKYPLEYPNVPNYYSALSKLTEYSHLKFEEGADSDAIKSIFDKLSEKIDLALTEMVSLEIDNNIKTAEPDDYEKIIALRSEGPRCISCKFDRDKYMEKIMGALYGRFAGCILGAIVEGWSSEVIKAWADFNGEKFPPEDYWKSCKDPSNLRYGVSYSKSFTRGNIDGAPVDDDITYTILGLLIAEEYSHNFTTENVGEAWIKYLPTACTAEEAALKNLWAGVHALKAAEIDNPYCQWIGADIRADPWGYMAPGMPEKAAKMAYRDAYISHRRNGIYGEMFFAAAIAAAFEVDNTMDALKIGLSEIPKECMLANDIRWAFNECANIHNYKEAIDAVVDRFGAQSRVHTNNNACLTIFGLSIGGNDFTKVISETVAMGYDNDCTAATAGSIIGTVLGKKGIPKKWYECFNNKVYTYMKNRRFFAIDDLAKRFTAQAEIVTTKS